MDAVSRGDMGTAARMVREAATKAGYETFGFHGTRGEFTVFDKKRIGTANDEGWLGRGFYFWDRHNEDYAQQYARGGKVMEVYLSMQEPYFIGNEEMERLIDALDRHDVAELEDFTDGLKEEGYDSVIDNNGQMLVFELSQIKSADPVTYDDAGNVIPLSQRFNPERDDIRYSIVPINGRDMMVVANSLLTAKEAQDETKVRDILRNTIVGKEFAQLGEPTDKLVKVSPKFVKEFWNSEQAKSQRKIAKLWRAKVGAAVNLEDLLATTPLGPKEAPKHTNGQFKNGATFYRCPAKFGVFVPGMGINVYPCSLLILETKSGKRYAFDIADMEKPTLAAIGSLSGETLELLQGGGSNGGSVRPATLPQVPASVNPPRPSVAPVPSAFDPGRLPASMKWGTLHGHDGNIVGLVAMSRLVGKRLTNDEISDLAQRLGVEMSAKEIKAAAQDLADSEIGALALGRAANGDMAGGMAILAGTAEPPSTDRELVDAAFRAGAKRGMAADAMRRKVTADVLAAQRGADLAEIVREFGFDVAKMLHSREIEAEKRPEGAKPLDTLPNPYDFAGAMEDPDGTKASAHEARVAEARRIAAERFSALFDEARRMQEYREEVDAETAGKSGGGTVGDAAASSYASIRRQAHQDGARPKRSPSYQSGHLTA